MDWTESFRMRRILTAVALFLLTSTGGLGVIGFAVAGEPSGLPGLWTLPEHRIGDTGTYTVTVVERAGGNVTVVEEETPLFDFAWLPSTQRYDMEGQAHHVHRLATQPHGVGDDLGIRYAAPIYEFDSTTDRLVAYTYENGEVGSSGSRQINFVDEDGGHVPPCGSKTPLAGTTFDPTRSTVLFPDCGWHAYWAPDVAFSARARDTLGENPALYFERSDPHNHDQDMHLWLSADHPYPLRFAVEDQGHADRFFVIRLTSFTRGDEQLVAGEAGEDLPPMPWVGFDKGLPEGRPDHPFPARDAYEASLGHDDADGLRGFMRAHPDAYVAWSHYRVDLDDQDERTWTFIVGDGDATYTWSLTATREAPVNGPRAIQAELEEDVLVFSDEPRTTTSIRVPPPSMLPDRIPDPEWLHALWRANSPWPEEEAGWAVVASCGNDCADLYLEVGYAVDRERHTGSGGVLPGGQGGTEIVHSELAYRIDTLRGDSVHAWDWTVPDCSQGCTSGDEPPAGFGGHGQASLHTTVHYDTAVWGIPAGGVVAGAAVFSLLAALAYLFWPALKSGMALSLFSRINDPKEVVGHPVRRGIVDLVTSQPGIHLREIQRRLGLGRGALDHHVRKLVQVDVLKRIDGPGKTCLFLKGSRPFTQMQAAPLLQSAGARRVFDAVRARPDASMSAIADDIGRSVATVHHHVNRLKHAGLIDVRKTQGRAEIRARAHP